VLYPEFSTPETGGLVCQFQHPTLSRSTLAFGASNVIKASIQENYFIKKDIILHIQQNTFLCSDELLI